MASIWHITPEDRAKHDAQFMQLRPVNGMITGEQAKNYFLKSNLPGPILGHIWGLADLNADGKMDQKEFSIAVFLIQKRLQGVELPKTLPQSLTADPIAQKPVGIASPPGAGARGMMGLNQFAPTSSSFGIRPMGMPNGGGYSSATLPPGGITSPTGGAGSFSTLPKGATVGASPAGTPSGDWAIPQPQKLKYNQMFNMHDRSRKGYLTGIEARNILMQSNLSHAVLAQVWSLADVDSDGKLTPDEFCLAMFLVDMSKGGTALPQKLPPNLIPPSYRKGGSPAVTPSAGPQQVQSPAQTPPTAPSPGGMAQSDAFGDLLGGIGMAPPPLVPQQDATAQPDQKADNPVTFEDRRKENFAKGNAELERRRQALLEEQRKEEEERRNKEKAEQEKREQKRLEQERKKQQEMEKMQEKQRALEQERENARRKALEQREAARKELERQRQLEWERQRKEQLIAERQKEQNQVEQMQSVVSNLKLELDALDNKKVELANKIQQAKNGVTEFTSAIDTMRSSRDVKKSDIAKFDQEIREWNQKLYTVRSEKNKLNEQLETQLSTVGDTYKTVLHSKNNKEANIKRMKDLLQKVEGDTQTKTQDTEKAKSELTEINNNLTTVKEQHQSVYDNMIQKKKEWEEMKKKKEQERLEQLENERKAQELARIAAAQEASRKAAEEEAARKAAEEEAEKARQAAAESAQAPTWNTADSWGTTGTADAWGNSTTENTSTENPASKNAWESSGSFAEKDEPNNMDFLSVDNFRTLQRSTSSEVELSDCWLGARDQSESEDSFSNKKDVFGTTQSSDPFGFSSSGFGTTSNAFGSTAKNNSQATTDKSKDFWGSAFESQFAEFASTAGSKNGAFSSQTTTNTTSSWGGSFFNTPSQSSQPTINVPNESPGPGHKKYKGVFQFEARNSDELSFQPGDIVWVKPDQSGSEPGWLSGVMAGNEGVFPENYVELVEDEGTAQPEPEPEQTNGGFENFDSGETQAAAEPSNFLPASEGSPFAAVAGSASSPTPGEGQSAPDGLQAQAQYPWRAKKDNHLTFNKGDIIIVKEQQDMWWSGELNGKIGWFPKSYVKLIGSSAAAKTDFSEAIASTPEGLPSEPVTEAPAPATEQGEIYVAAYTYSSGEPGDLEFTAGQEINVIKKDGEWWTGIVGDKKGIFPANYVTEPTQQQEESQFVFPPQQTAAATDSPVAGTPTQSQSQTPTPQTPVSAVEKKTKKPEIATIIAPYQATGPEQLSLVPGQLIQIRKKSDSGWWEGELQARGQKRKIGWFPANYVKILGGSARNTPDRSSLTSSPLTTPTLGGSSSRGPTPVIPQPSTAPALEQVIASFNYQAINEDELTFMKGSVINVINKDDPDWWKGELNGQTGVFPSNYVAPLSDATGSDGTAASSQMSYNWGDVSDTERQRQIRIHELLDTEESYLKDLLVAKKVFYKSIAQSRVLTEEEVNKLFINWSELIMCNTKLEKAIRVRKRTCADRGEGKFIQNIGDILCENLPNFKPYIRFCSCQLNAAALLQSKTENDPQFKEVHKKCVQDPAVKGMPLSAYLLKPMQRITKYPLLIQQILKYTPEDNHDHQNLQDALSKATELCNEVNEGVREKENSDKLEWIQTHCKCEGLAENITFNSTTNCLGNRKYLYSGTLYKVKSGKELVGFLFNDFLLLAQPKKSLEGVASVFSFDVKVDQQFKMYRTPIFLNDVMVKKGTDEDGECSTTFSVAHLDKMFVLRAVSQSERDNWVKKIEAASKHYKETEKKKREKAHSLKKAPMVGRLLVVIMEGTNLTPGEDGKSDPYCEVSMGTQEHKTKVINNNLNPKWNASMQFNIKDPKEDTLCITVYDRDFFTPNDFLGRTEIRIQDIQEETKERKGPITKTLQLHEVRSGEVIVKLDLQLFKH